MCIFHSARGLGLESLTGKYEPPASTFAAGQDQMDSVSCQIGASAISACSANDSCYNQAASAYAVIVAAAKAWGM